MAYYPRDYYPDLDSDYPPPPSRPDYPPYEPYYPRRRQVYLPYEPEYPPDRPTKPPTKSMESDVRIVHEYNYVVNKKYKYYGIILCFLAIASFAIEIANVVFTITWFTNNSLAMPYLLTWIAPGIWGSIPVFIAGVLAIKVAGTPKTQVRVFVLFCSLSAVVFTPAMIAISVAEIILYPANSIRYGGNNCYSFNDMGTLTCPKFVLPLVVAILGGIEFYLTLMVTVVYCFCDPRPGKETKKKKVDVSSLSAEDQPTDAPFSPYPEMVQRRQAPYYRSLPPNGLAREPMGADPENQIVQFPSRGVVAPNMSFLCSYYDSRPCTSRGFGIAPAYNHGLSYGNFPGAAAASPFYGGSIPSLGAFGDPGPNPAYRVVYN